MGIVRDRRLAEIEALYAERRTHFVRVARAITGDRESAVEAVHDGFADAIRSRSGFRGDGPLEAWVWRAVVNAARRCVRSRLASVPLGELDDVSAPRELPELAPLIAALPERQRLVVFLRYYADLDYRAIAAALEIEVGTVGASLEAAHRSVRRSLQEVRLDA
jgi:RNA polymerase sigma-70 factor (ECF subfamily)